MLQQAAKYCIMLAIVLWLPVNAYYWILSSQVVYWRFPEYRWWITFVLLIVLPTLALFNSELARRKKSYGRSLLMSAPVVFLAAAQLFGRAVH